VGNSTGQTGPTAPLPPSLPPMLWIFNLFFLITLALTNDSAPGWWCGSSNKSACLASVRPWVQNPSTERKKKKQMTAFQPEMMGRGLKSRPPMKPSRLITKCAHQQHRRERKPLPALRLRNGWSPGILMPRGPWEEMAKWADLTRKPSHCPSGDGCFRQAEALISSPGDHRGI
jgi:hypothetical protein